MQRKKIRNLRLDVRANGVITRRLRPPDVVKDHLLKKGFVDNYYDCYLHYNSKAGSVNMVDREELQQYTVQNLYVQMVYDASASNFSSYTSSFSTLF